jgi:hypothetical protein
MVAAVFHWTPNDVSEMTHAELHRWAEDAEEILKMKAKAGILG